MKPFYDRNGITIYCGDCLEVMPNLAGINAVITDPPYGIGADKKNAHSSIRDKSDWDNYNWDNQRPSVYHFEMMLKLARVCAFWGGNYFADLLPPSSGWLVWRKPEAETGFSLADVELCWTNQKFAARCITLPRRDGNIHPTQKPVSLMRWCIQQVNPHGLICDPYMGSGSTLVAAQQLGYPIVGIELIEAYCKIAVERLRQPSFLSLPDNHQPEVTKAEQATLW